MYCISLIFQVSKVSLKERKIGLLRLRIEASIKLNTDQIIFKSIVRDQGSLFLILYLFLHLFLNTLKPKLLM